MISCKANDTKNSDIPGNELDECGFFRYLVLAGYFLNFLLSEIQLGAQCLMGESGPLPDNTKFVN